MVTTENLAPLFDRDDQLAFDIKDHPKLTEGETPEILLKDPQKVAPVKLPLIEYYGGKIRYGMHTDMITKLIRMIASLNYKTRDGLYIQGRMPNKEQWAKLQNHPAYVFFLNSRLTRSHRSEQQEVVGKMENPPKGLSVLLPKGVVTLDEAREYARMEYTPKTKLVGLSDIPVAWYKVDFLHQLYELRQGSENSFLPLLGGFNGFSVGSDTLPSGIVMKASLYMMKQYEDAIDGIILDSPLSDKARAQFDNFPLDI